MDADPVLRAAFSNRHGRESAWRRRRMSASKRSSVVSRRSGFRHVIPVGGTIAVERIWRKLGFRSAPRSGHRLQNGRYPDLISDDGVVGEVKNVIGPNLGPTQLAGYIRQLRLIHGAQKLSPAARNALDACGEDITVWSVDESRRATRQCP
jgi:hypothetical protein